MEIAIDFDGTCVTHDYPNIGKHIGAEAVLRLLTDAGHNLILFTMRCDVDGYEESGVFYKPKKHLTEAVQWFEKHNIPLYGIQKNPGQESWTQSNKCYAQLYIDDAALGCPLIHNLEYSLRPYVDWLAVYDILVEMKALPFEDMMRQRQAALKLLFATGKGPLIPA